MQLGDTIDVFCLECHDARRAVGGVDLEALARDPSDPAVDPDLVLRVRDRLRARDMPPLVPGESATDGIRPDDDEYRRAIAATGAILATRARDGGVPPVTVGRLGRRALRGSIVDLFGEFFQGFVNHARVTLHVDNLRGKKTVSIEKMNSPRLIGVAGNPGIAS